MLGLIILALFSCNDDDSDFTGDDNYIISFDLTLAGVSYPAAISGDEIILSIPEGVSLSNATARVVLSENSSIVPDPAGITDWNAEEQFVVSSYNHKRKSYIYRIQRRPISTTGNVILSTQAEVDAFAATGVSIIDGNLTIGKATASTAADTIRDLSGLSALRQVVHNITIHNTYAGTNLSGLANLEKAGGLSIGTADSLTEVYFPRLTTIGTTISIGSTTIESIKMPELSFVGESFNVKSDALESYDFSELTSIGGSMTFNGTNGSAQNNKKEYVAFPKLESVGGALTMSYWVAATKIDLPVLKSVGGMITLSYWNKIDAMSFPALETAGGLTMNNSTSLAELNLPVLKTLDGNMALNLSSIGSLFVGSLTEIKGGLTLTLAGATDLTFSELESVSGTLSIPSTASKLVMPYFPKLRYIGTDLDIRTSAMTDMTGFAALEEIGAKLYLYNAGNITSLAGLGSLKKVGTSYYLYGLTKLTELDLRGVETPLVSLYLSTYTDLKITGDNTFPGKLDFGTPVSGLSVFPKLIGFKTVGDISFSMGSNYKGALEIEEIEEITGTLTISYCNYTPMVSLPDLKKAGNITFTSSNYGITQINMPALEEITGNFTYPTGYASSYGGPLNAIHLPKLKKVGGNFSLTGIAKEHTLSGINMPLIESIGGTLTISGSNNINFSDINNFSNLSSVGSINISNFTNLKNFEGFKEAIPSLNSATWKISGCGYNPSYQNMTAGIYLQL